MTHESEERKHKIWAVCMALLVYVIVGYVSYQLATELPNVSVGFPKTTGLIVGGAASFVSYYGLLHLLRKTNSQK